MTQIGKTRGLTKADDAAAAMIRLAREFRDRLEEISQLTGMEIDDASNVIETFTRLQSRKVREEVLQG